MTRVKGQQPETKIVSAIDNQEIAAALSADTDGNAIDRQDYQWPRSIKFVATVSGDLDDTADDLELALEDAADDGTGSPDTWADTGDTFNVTDADAPGIVVFEVDVSDKRRHTRLYLDANDSTLDTASDLGVLAVLSGMKVIPQD